MPRRVIERTEIDEILKKAPVGNLSMNGTDGYPYSIPVHFLYEEGKLYFHSGIRGMKIDNLSADGRVCFGVSEMEKIIDTEDRGSCDLATKYSSVIIFGTAKFVEDPVKKEAILQKLVGKFSPHREGNQFAEGMLAKTNVTEIIIERITGKGTVY